MRLEQWVSTACVLLQNLLGEFQAAVYRKTTYPLQQNFAAKLLPRPVQIQRSNTQVVLKLVKCTSVRSKLRQVNLGQLNLRQVYFSAV